MPVLLPASRLLGRHLQRSCRRSISRISPVRRGPQSLHEFNIDFATPLGSGACGVVFSGLHRGTDKEVAIKVMSPALTMPGASSDATGGIHQEEEAFERVLQSGTTHPHLVDILGRFEGPCDEAVQCGLQLEGGAKTDDPVHYFVMERLGNESLADRIKAEGGLEEREAKEVTRAICQALAFLHDQGIAHRDVKPANVLFPRGDHSEPKLIDFSHSGVLPEDTDKDAAWFDRKLGTAGYVAPEVLSEQAPYSTKCDVYSLGCTVHAMLANGRLPRRHARAGIIKSVPDGVSSSLEEFLDATLCPNPADRPTIEEALKEPWLGSQDQ